ncbi:MAG TPA: hypothetical protein VMZ33_04735 [Candidatus Limnocylindrales bacterium]|nr:hypothetical protein [Candidatus Limnocylindrales bacterium]
MAATIALAAAALPMAAGSVAAGGAQPPDHGAGVRCKYTTDADTNWAFRTPLRRIAVLPPEIYARTARQTVGWRFLVNRLIDEGENPQWQVTYPSSLQRGSATSTQPANFDTLRVGVTVPRNVEDRRNVTYTVTLKMYWFRADGSVASKASILLDDYTQYLNGENWGGDDHCPGIVWAAV